MLFDTHAHYDDKAFDSDREEVLSAMTAGGVGYIVNPACTAASIDSSRRIAERWPFVWFAAGIHPENAAGESETCLDAVLTALDHPRCAAVGEIGLDYHYGRESEARQKELFDAQLSIAQETGLPALIHIRDAMADGMDILRAHRGVRGVLHCYSGSWETAKEALDMGLYISFTGVITFKNARRAAEVAERMSGDRIMIETDSPYMAPEPYRGRRCSSLYLPEICRRVAEIRGISEAEAEALTTENALRFYEKITLRY